jgi:hypothetical protein
LKKKKIANGGSFKVRPLFNQQLRPHRKRPFSGNVTHSFSDLFSDKSCFLASTANKSREEVDEPAAAAAAVPYGPKCRNISASYPAYLLE